MQQKKIYIIGNWKMYLTAAESVALMSAVARQTNISHDRITVVVCPSFTALSDVGRVIRESGSAIQLGAQDVFWEVGGAFTGEVSAHMLKALGCHFVIIGHSERREYLCETDEMTAKKMKAAFQAGLQPILCIGETAIEREAHTVQQVLKNQLTAGLSLLQSASTPLIVAYEPRWAIGSGMPVDPAEAARSADVIRAHAGFRGFAPERVTVLYGGSVVAENVESFCEAQSIDGVLVGGASAKKDQFIDLIHTLCG